MMVNVIKDRIVFFLTEETLLMSSGPPPLPLSYKTGLMTKMRTQQK